MPEINSPARATPSGRSRYPILLVRLIDRAKADRAGEWEGRTGFSLQAERSNSAGGRPGGPWKQGMWGRAGKGEGEQNSGRFWCNDV